MDAASRFGIEVAAMTFNVTKESPIPIPYIAPEAGAQLPILPQWIILLAVASSFASTTSLCLYVRYAKPEDSASGGLGRSEDKQTADKIITPWKMWAVISFEVSRLPTFYWADVQGDFEFANDPTFNVRSFAILFMVLSHLSFGISLVIYRRIRPEKKKVMPDLNGDRKAVTEQANWYRELEKESKKQKRAHYSYLLVALSAFDFPQIVIYAMLEAGKLGTSAGAIVGVTYLWPLCDKFFKIYHLKYPASFEERYNKMETRYKHLQTFMLRPKKTPTKRPERRQSSSAKNLRALSFKRGAPQRQQSSPVNVRNSSGWGAQDHDWGNSAGSITKTPPPVERKQLCDEVAPASGNEEKEGQDAVP